MKFIFPAIFLLICTACSERSDSHSSSGVLNKNNDTFIKHELNHLKQKGGIHEDVARRLEGKLKPKVKVRNSDELYEFELPEDWQEKQNPEGKIEKMFFAPDNFSSFFVLRIPNPPDVEIQAPQLKAYVEGLSSRYRNNFHVLREEVVNKYGTSIGLVSFTYDVATPQGPLNIQNYCEVVVHKKNYFNVCGIAPSSAWEGKQQNITDIFSSWKWL